MKSKGCETYTRPVLIGVPVKDNVRYIFQPRCKMWNCQYCGHMNSLLWRERIRQGIDHYQQLSFQDWSFVTITMSRYTRGFAYSVSIWPNRWSKLSTRIRRLIPGVRYVLLPEQHKDGTLHTHAIFSGKITNTWISKNAHTCGLGYQSKSKAMDSAFGAAKYVTKYLTKTLDVQEWPPRFRRIRTSQKWPALTDDDSYEPIDAEWRYLSSYPSDGLDYLATGLTEKTGVQHKVV